MRRFLLPLLPLLLLLGLTLGNVRYLDRCVTDWNAALDTLCRCAAQARWEEAARSLESIQQDWQRQQRYLHIVQRHDMIGEADLTLALLALALSQRDEAETQRCACTLRVQLDDLVEIERCSLHNIL